MSHPTCREKCSTTDAARSREAAGRRARVRLWPVALDLNLPGATPRERCRALKLRRGGSRFELWGRNVEASGVDLTFATGPAADFESECQIPNSTRNIYFLVVL